MQCNGGTEQIKLNRQYEDVRPNAIEAPTETHPNRVAPTLSYNAWLVVAFGIPTRRNFSLVEGLSMEDITCSR